MKYVLITGASAGIGATFAKQLAAQGQHLILLARRQDRLQQLADQLSASHQIKVQTIVADLTSTDACEDVAQQITSQDWPLSGLINNAGFGQLGEFAEADLDRQLQMIQLNVTCVVALTHRLIPHLKRNSNAADGFIINVASTAAFQAGPNMAVYYASKAFVLSFSEALHEELKPQGISVSALCPGATQTEFAQTADMTNTLLFKLSVMEADDVVKKSLCNKKSAIVIPGWLNLLSAYSAKWTPRLVTRKIAAWLQQSKAQ